ncbi:hypothetical protein PAPYR_156 [Paratrimastix pyriformis]|uniref:COMM domain-containing protein 5 n=1 Tax=Paratrimastix pyriformis TaxID=342808 RepID=A0ABQ8UWU2_9EUKA|nr:hypothetical protein PAPYR_156 [Paratrimastix pyriformis]
MWKTIPRLKKQSLVAMQKTVEYERLGQLLGDTVTATQWKATLDLSSECLQQSPLFSEDRVREANVSLGMEQKEYAALFTATYLALRHAVRMWKPSHHARGMSPIDTYVQQLQAELQGANWRPQYVAPFLECLAARLEALRDSVAGQCMRMPASVSSMRWRVEVSLSTSSMNRVLRPAVILEVTLTDGNIRTLELDMATFHQLRYNTAKILKDMLTLEQTDTLQRAL